MLYLYAIIDPPKVGPSLPPGLEGAPLDILRFEGVSAAASQISGGAPEASVENLRCHLSIQNALMTHGAVLPLRFGALFSGRELLDAYISAFRETFVADLDRLRGHVEIGLRVSAPREPASAHPVELDVAALGTEKTLGPGASYLAAKGIQAAHDTRQKRAMAALAATVMEPLAPLAAAHTWRALSFDPPVLSVAILLREDSLDAFKRALPDLRRSQPRLAILCTGPWPPYSLVSNVEAFGGEGFAGR